MIADTEVLFAFQENDPHYGDLRVILELAGHQIVIPHIACFEMLIILTSQNLLSSDIQQIFELIDDIRDIYRISYAPFELTHLVKGIEVYKEIFNSRTGTFFNSLMIGIAINLKTPLLGNDKIFQSPRIRNKLEGFKALTFKDALSQLK
ncbi:MAG: PIN domain-containing protein [Candidatus Thorarchaeota archaeon]